MLHLVIVLAFIGLLLQVDCVWLEGALLLLLECRLSLLHLHSHFFLLKPGLATLVHTFIESFRLAHPHGFRWANRLIILRILGCSLLLSLLRLLLSLFLLLLDKHLLFKHELFEFLITGALLSVLISLMSGLLLGIGLLYLLIIHVLFQLVARQILIGSLKLGSNLVEKLLVKLLFVDLVMIGLTRGHWSDGWQIKIEGQNFIDPLFSVGLIAKSELRVKTERLVLETRDTDHILLLICILLVE